MTQDFWPQAMIEAVVISYFMLSCALPNADFDRRDGDILDTAAVPAFT